jgi:hypothetical protein
MLQSMRSREKWRCAERSQTDKYYYIRMAHIGPLDLGPYSMLFLRSLTALGPSPDAPGGGVRGNADGPSSTNRSIDPVQFSSIQSNSNVRVPNKHCMHCRTSALRAGPCIHSFGQATKCPEPPHLEVLLKRILGKNVNGKAGTNRDKRIRYKIQRVA